MKPINDEPQSKQDIKMTTTYVPQQHTSPADTPFAGVLSMILVRCEAVDDGLSRTGLSRALAGLLTIDTPAGIPAQKQSRPVAETTTENMF